MVCELDFLKIERVDFCLGAIPCIALVESVGIQSVFLS